LHTLAIPTFSCYSYPHPRDLPSFPTRRSSDLGGRQPERVVIGVVPPLRLHSPSPGCRVVVLVARALAHEVRVHALRVRRLGNRGDRKSTRLNSSHDQISYAVFCLKKKKKQKKV